MIAFIDDHRAAYGVEPICRVLPITPSTYHAHAANGSIPARPRQERDGMRCCGHRSDRCSRRISPSTACARSGDSSVAKAIGRPLYRGAADAPDGLMRRRARQASQD